MGHTIKIILLAFILLPFESYNQSPLDSFRLDYNVPESPAFSILDANPTDVMRGSTAQNAIINFASDYLQSDVANSGLAIDFVPFYILGGKIKSQEEYKSNLCKRYLSNTQLSLATVTSDLFPEDLLISVGGRLTLFDSKDPVLDKQLLSDIRSILPKSNPDDTIFDDYEDGKSETGDMDFSKAYKFAKKRYLNKRGGSISIGAAFAQRAKHKSLFLDSLSTFRTQFWISGNYDSGIKNISVSGLLMYRKESSLFDEKTNGGLIAGIAFRNYREKSIWVAEITYDSMQKGFSVGGYSEFYVVKTIILFASIKYEINELNGKYEKVFKPGIKWNMSEKKNK